MGCVAIVCLLLTANALSVASKDPIWRQFLQLPNNNSARAHLEQLETRPHLAGTPGDLWTAEYVQGKLSSYGLEVVNTTFDVYLPYPVSAQLRGVAPFRFQAALKEMPFPQVEFTGRK